MKHFTLKMRLQPVSDYTSGILNFTTYNTSGSLKVTSPHLVTLIHYFQASTHTSHHCTDKEDF